MERTGAIVIGGGQAGLAMSYHLRARGIDHLVLERGRVAERWRSERWDSLRLLTPSWQSRLPGWHYRGPDPDGFMSVAEVTAYLEAYARYAAAPLQTGTTVLAVEPAARGYRVVTDQGTHLADNVVIATGYCAVPARPELARAVAGDIHQLTPGEYRRPALLPAGGVLVVGAAASGVQLADELRAAGRPVTLAVGRHTRLPRTYRGRDICWWMDRMGLFDRTIDQVRDVGAARDEPPFQLVGRPDRATLDLRILQDRGVRLVGRAIAADGDRIDFADDLAATTRAADDRLTRLLGRIDAHAAATGLEAGAGEPAQVMPIRPAPPLTSLRLREQGIRTIVWATGFGRDYSFLRLPVVDEQGELRHDGGVTEAPGLYALGLRFMRRRKSSLIDGVGDDARDLANHIAARLGHRERLAA